jgi:galactokinase
LIRCSSSWALPLTTQQAASVFCLPGQLLHLSFHPELSPDLLPLPSSLALVITNSLEPHALADSAPERYNLRVFENLCAVRLLLHSWKVEVDGSPPRSKEEAGRVWMKEALAYLQDSLGLSEEESFKRVAQDLDSVLGVDGRDEKGWTLEEIVAASGMSREEFDDTFTKFIEGESGGCDAVPKLGAR